MPTRKKGDEASYQETLFKVFFGDNELTKYIRVTKDFQRPIAPDVEINSEAFPGADGSRFYGMRYATRKISIPYVLRVNTQGGYEQCHEEIRKNLMLLAEQLHTREPKMLTFSDEPDYYFVAIPTGGFDVNENNWKVSGTLEFECFDPFRYRTYAKPTDTHGDTKNLNKSKPSKDVLNQKIALQGSNYSKISGSKIVIDNRGHFYVPINFDIIPDTELKFMQLYNATTGQTFQFGLSPNDNVTIPITRDYSIYPTPGESSAFGNSKKIPEHYAKNDTKKKTPIGFFKVRTPYYTTVNNKFTPATTKSTPKSGNATMINDGVATENLYHNWRPDMGWGGTGYTTSFFVTGYYTYDASANNNKAYIKLYGPMNRLYPEAVVLKKKRSDFKNDNEWDKYRRKEYKGTYCKASNGQHYSYGSGKNKKTVKAKNIPGHMAGWFIKDVGAGGGNKLVALDKTHYKMRKIGGIEGLWDTHLIYNQSKSLGLNVAQATWTTNKTVVVKGKDGKPKKDTKGNTRTTTQKVTHKQQVAEYRVPVNPSGTKAKYLGTHWQDDWVGSCMVREIKAHTEKKGATIIDTDDNVQDFDIKQQIDFNIEAGNTGVNTIAVLGTDGGQIANVIFSKTTSDAKKADLYFYVSGVQKLHLKSSAQICSAKANIRIERYGKNITISVNAGTYAVSETYSGSSKAARFVTMYTGSMYKHKPGSDAGHAYKVTKHTVKEGHSVKPGTYSITRGIGNKISAKKQEIKKIDKAAVKTKKPSKGKAVVKPTKKKGEKDKDYQKRLKEWDKDNASKIKTYQKDLDAYNKAYHSTAAKKAALAKAKKELADLQKKDSVDGNANDNAIRTLTIISKNEQEKMTLPPVLHPNHRYIINGETDKVYETPMTDGLTNHGNMWDYVDIGSQTLEVAPGKNEIYVHIGDGPNDKTPSILASIQEKYL